MCEKKITLKYLKEKEKNIRLSLKLNSHLNRSKLLENPLVQINYFSKITHFWLLPCLNFHFIFFF